MTSVEEELLDGEFMDFASADEAIDWLFGEQDKK